jgi:hypothetical protein
MVKLPESILAPSQEGSIALRSTVIAVTLPDRPYWELRVA